MQSTRRQFLRWAGVAAGAAMTRPLWGAAQVAEGMGDRPNVVMIIADDMGWNDIGYHNDEIVSPHLDRLCKEGVELNWHYVQPQCTPTRVALMTGRYPSRWGSGPTQASNDQAFPPGTTTLASMFKSCGYDTAIMGKWHMGSRPEWGPNHHGFDYSYGSLAGAVGMYDHRYRLDTEYAQTWHRNLEYLDIQKEVGHATDLVTDEAIQWLHAGRNKPFFLYLPYHSVHTPLVEETKWLGMNEHIIDPDRRLMAAAVTHFDACIGRVLTTIDELGKREQTLVVFLSDNGGIATSYPGGYYPPPDSGLKQGFSSNDPLRAGKTDVYEGGMRVPACVAWPGRLTPGKCDAVMHCVDWMPTLAKLIGYDPGEQLRQQWDGLNVWLYIKDTKRPQQTRELYWVWRGPSNKIALRLGDWKLLRNGRNASWELYNLADDPNEMTNLAERRPDKVRELKLRIQAQATRDPDTKPLLKLDE